MYDVEKGYQMAKDFYAQYGVDVDKAIEIADRVPISMHCWQGDDVAGLEKKGDDALTGGIQATGNYPGKARNAEELRQDIEEAMKFIPGELKLNLHASYLEADTFVDRDAIEPKHFDKWVDWANEHSIGLDFNPTYFSHPKSSNGTLSSADEDVRQFWIEHGIRSRKIGEYFYEKTGKVCVINHWTPDGAYRAYQQFCTLKNLTPFDCNVYTKITVPDFYGTHYSATRRWNAQADSFSYYDLPNQMTVYKVNGEADYEPVKTEGLMNLAKLDTRDKYGAFLDGNNGYSVIEGNGTGSILVVKDSYANSFIPYLTANYAKIGVVDFRGLAYGLDSTIEKEGYDQILILYNFQTFISDNKVIYLDRPTTLK